MYQPELPLFMVSDEDEDITVAPSQAWAEGQMEPPEVANGYYVVVDAAGRRARLTVDKWSVLIDGWSEDADLSDLQVRLWKYLDFHSLRVASGLAPREFIQTAAGIISTENRKLNWPKRPAWLNKLLHHSAGRDPTDLVPQQG